MILIISKPIQVSSGSTVPLLGRYWKSAHYPTGRTLWIKDGKIALETKLVNYQSTDREFWLPAEGRLSGLVLEFYEVAQWMS